MVETLDSLANFCCSAWEVLGKSSLLWVGRATGRANFPVCELELHLEPKKLIGELLQILLNF
jgi:hypothetical protein